MSAGRTTKAHEYVFLLSKSPSYFYDSEAIREEAIHAGKVVTLGEKSLSKGQANARGVAASGNGLASSVVVADGRNKRSVWEIATAPFPEAHFATFPVALVEPCIKAGTSERGCCPQCGAPWVRVVERAERIRPLRQGKYTETGANGTNRVAGAAYEAQRQPDLTLGWQPTCRCDAGEPVPCTVLDPFGGSGTTGLVADRLGRDAILVELNPAYATMARARVQNDNPLFTEVQSA